MIKAVDVKWTIALVCSGFAASGAEKLASPEVTTEGIWLVFSFHVFTLPRVSVIARGRRFAWRRLVPRQSPTP